VPLPPCSVVSSAHSRFPLRDLKDAGFSAAELLRLPPPHPRGGSPGPLPAGATPARRASAPTCAPGGGLPLTPAPLWSPPAPVSRPSPASPDAAGASAAAATRAAPLVGVAEAWRGGSASELRAAGFGAAALLEAGVALEALVNEVGVLRAGMLLRLVVTQVKSSVYSFHGKEPNPQRARQSHARKAAVYCASGGCSSRFRHQSETESAAGRAINATRVPASHCNRHSNF
jgi:hypothetical protein